MERNFKKILKKKERTERDGEGKAESRKQRRTQKKEHLPEEKSFLNLCPKLFYHLPSFPFSHTFLKKERNTMSKATAAMSPIRIASVFSISLSLLLLSLSPWE